MKFLKQITLLLITIAALTHCGSNQDQTLASRLLIFSVGDSLVPTANLTTQLKEKISTEEKYFYQVEIFNKNDPVGEPVTGPVKADIYNIENNLYSIHTKLNSQDYLVSFVLVKSFDLNDVPPKITSTQEPASEIYVLKLAATNFEITIDQNIVDIDLTQQPWSFDIDDDGDGLTNLDELNTDLDPFNTDTDQDGVADDKDHFPNNSEENTDSDSDGFGDNSDNCVQTPNTDQIDTDKDGTGDSCDNDKDNDDVPDNTDNCPDTNNPDQADMDSDNVGDVCDEDRDGDGISNSDETSQGTNPDTADSDADGINDPFDEYPNDSDENKDSDKDSVGDNSDNCPFDANPDQKDNDFDGVGDTCDPDDDNDGVSDLKDNCPLTLKNLSHVINFESQTDSDKDGFGIPCDCDDNNPSFNPDAQDDPDTLTQDLNCDGIDGNTKAAVFVSLLGSIDATSTNQNSPTNNIQAAISWANEHDYDVYIAAGSYELPDFKLTGKTSLYGGFSQDFSSRTALVSDATNTTLKITNSFSGDTIVAIQVEKDTTTTLASLKIVTAIESKNQISVFVDNADLTVINSQLIGNQNSQNETLIEAQDSTLHIESTSLEGYSLVSTTLLNTFKVSGSLINNIFNAGIASNTTALRLNQSHFDITNNTIDGGRHDHGTAFGLVTQESNLIVSDNIFITNNNNNQASIRCLGQTPPAPMKLEGNLFYRFSSDYVYAAYITCRDSSYLITNADIEAGTYPQELSATDNNADTNTDYLEIADELESQYRLETKN